MPIHNDPDEAALIGSLHLAPAWIFKGHDSILAIDIGGTNIRAGVVLPNVAKASDLTKASVWKSEKWRHADEEKLNREQAVDELVGMLKDLIKRAKKEGLDLAPFIGIALSRARSRRTATSPRARRTCRATGKAAASTCRRGSPMRSRRSASTTSRS